MGCQSSCGGVGESKCRAAVETIPTEPEDEGAQDQERDVVGIEFRAVGIIESAQTGTQDNGAAECTDTTCHVHNAAASKVIVANVCDCILTAIEPAGTAPSPKDHDWIDKGSQPARVDRIRVEVDSLGHAAADNCSRCATEGPLEEPADDVIGWAFVSSLNTIKDEILSEVLLVACKLGGWLSICSIRHHPAKRPPTERSQTDIEEIFQHQVLCVLSSASSAFQHCKPCLHQHHQRAADQQPQVVHSPS
mmetsp:Transcript_43435/g.97829  ORF Transcript_43435/g.97829 Transcript_43435/m.97829 type:complete len:249 (-) Transcript_43435:408-1154(-)